MRNKILLTIAVLLLFEEAGFCISPSIKEAVIKFSLAMGGVILSSVIIFIGLSIYNKIRSGFVSEVSPEEEILQTPKTKEDAVRFFIRKNRL